MGLIYVINARGTSVFNRMRLTLSNILSVVVPDARARISASWITIPSATGSEKGMPISIRSAPASAMAGTNSSVTLRSGSPAVINGINAFLFSNTFCILFIEFHPPVSCNCRNVLISPAGKIDHNDLVFVHGSRHLPGIGHCMGALHSRDDAFHA